MAQIIAANQKTTTVVAGTNVSITPATPSPIGNTAYTVNVPTANGTTLGVVRQAAANPTVNVAADGTLSINTGATGIGRNLTAADGSLQVVTGGTNATLVATSLQVAAGGITTAKLATNAVATGNIQDNAITTNKIADLAIQTRHVADDAITPVKIANAGNNQVLVY
ncbi:hypothetical protein D3C87_71260 [compost metagenome]